MFSPALLIINQVLIALYALFFNVLVCHIGFRVTLGYNFTTVFRIEEVWRCQRATRRTGKNGSFRQRIAALFAAIKNGPELKASAALA
jgi:hypothetical protein